MEDLFVEGSTLRDSSGASLSIISEPSELLERKADLEEAVNLLRLHYPDAWETEEASEALRKLNEGIQKLNEAIIQVSACRKVFRAIGRDLNNNIWDLSWANSETFTTIHRGA